MPSFDLTNCTTKLGATCSILLSCLTKQMWTFLELPWRCALMRSTSSESWRAITNKSARHSPFTTGRRQYFGDMSIWLHSPSAFRCDTTMNLTTTFPFFLTWHANHEHWQTQNLASSSIRNQTRSYTPCLENRRRGLISFCYAKNNDTFFSVSKSSLYLFYPNGFQFGVLDLQSQHDTP